MTILYWLLFIISAISVAGCLGAAITMGMRFRETSYDNKQREAIGAIASLSMIVPIKGVDSYTEAHLNALVESLLEPGTLVEYLFAMESADDPAYAVCQHVQTRHPEQHIRIILTGPASGRMGKQHNLAIAVREVRYEAIGSMDADVQVSPDTLAVGLRYLVRPDSGVVYFLPQYVAPGQPRHRVPARGTPTIYGPPGGLLVALYSNYYYQLFMGSLALNTRAAFITGGLWLMRVSTLKAIGGLEQFGLTVSDDAAIGQAVRKQGLRNVLVPRTVRIPFEQLGLRAGGRHLLKWLAMLRAEGIGVYLSILFSWHPVLWSLVTLLTGLLLLVLTHSSLYLLCGLVLFLVALVIKLASGLILNHRVYVLPALRYLPLLIAYELLAVPFLFSAGLFRRTIVWKGRKYVLGRHGRIMG